MSCPAPQTRHSCLNAYSGYRLARTLLVFVVAACSGDAGRLAAPAVGEAALAKGTNAPAPSVPVVSGLNGTTTSIRSDGAGPYVDATDGVISIVHGIGDWLLDASGRASARAIHIDLSDPLPGSEGTAPFTSATLKTRIISKPSLKAAGGYLGMHGVGSTVRAPVSLAFAYGGATYAIRMNTDNHPATDRALGTCTATAVAGDPAASCTAWRIAPDGLHDGVQKNVGRLELTTRKGTVLIGYYYFTFDFEFVR